MLLRLRTEYDQAFRQWAAAMDEFHGRSELPNGEELSRNQELSKCVEAALVLYRETRNRFADALLERLAQRKSRRPQLFTATAAFASDSNAAVTERKAASGATFPSYLEPAMTLAARCCQME